MVQSFAGVLVFVVISTPVELYARVQLGRDVADVDPLHFGVQVRVWRPEPSVDCNAVR